MTAFPAWTFASVLGVRRALFILRVRQAALTHFHNHSLTHLHSIKQFGACINCQRPPASSSIISMRASWYNVGGLPPVPNNVGGVPLRQYDYDCASFFVVIFDVLLLYY